jgi:hypothetical protein
MAAYPRAEHIHPTGVTRELGGETTGAIVTI